MLQILLLYFLGVLIFSCEYALLFFFFFSFSMRITSSIDGYVLIKLLDSSGVSLGLTGEPILFSSTLEQDPILNIPKKE